MEDGENENEFEYKPTRQSLLNRLKDWRDDASWRTFFDLYWKLIYGTARKAGLPQPDAEDVVQDTIFSVAKAMPDFKYNRDQGSFKNWLLRITWRRILDHRHRRKSLQASSFEDASKEHENGLDNVPDENIARMWEVEWQRNLMDVAIERVKKRVEPRQYQLFDLVALQHWPTQRVVSAMKVSATQVYLAKHRISRLIRKEVRLLEREFPENA